jgi:hypothetical protein
MIEFPVTTRNIIILQPAMIQRSNEALPPGHSRLQYGVQYCAVRTLYIQEESGVVILARGMILTRPASLKGDRVDTRRPKKIESVLKLS